MSDKDEKLNGEGGEEPTGEQTAATEAAEAAEPATAEEAVSAEAGGEDPVAETGAEPADAAEEPKEEPPVEAAEERAAEDDPTEESSVKEETPAAVEAEATPAEGVEAPAAAVATAPAEAAEAPTEEPAEETAEATAEAPAAAAAAAVAAEAAPEPEQSRKRWYVIHTYSGHENKVKANLERAIQYARLQDKFGEVLVATEDYVVMKAGKKHITKRKTFPSYVLIEMEMDDETRALVQGIPGVTHFVGDKSAAPLSATEVARIRGEEVEEKGQVTTEVPFKVGESVRVTEGPFADFVGTVDEINIERGKLRVMVSIFGRPTAVELDITHVTNV